MSLQEQLEKKKYRNWVRGGLAYKYLKEGIKGFADDLVNEEHRRFNQDVISRRSCNQCSIRNLRPLHTCEKNHTGKNICPWLRNNCNCLYTLKKKCPNEVCDVIMEEIMRKHGSTPPTPNWKNTDIKKWCSAPWEIAKCYINASGYSDMSTVDDIDISGLLQIFINNIVYRAHLSHDMDRGYIFQKTLQRRNELFRSPTMEMEDCKLDECIDEIIAILEDEKELKARHDAQEAVLKLKQLKQDSNIITTYNKAEIFREQAEATEAVGNETKKEGIQVSQMPDRNQLQLPKEITDMDDETVETYIRALEEGKTEYNNIRIMVVGHFKVGKTTLVKRLFGQFKDQENTPSTNGIETHVRQCNVISDDENEKMTWKPLKNGNQTNWRQVLLQKPQNITAGDTSVEKIETTLATESELQPDGIDKHAISILENVERSDAAIVPQSSEEHKHIVQEEDKVPEQTQEQHKLNQQECVMRLMQNSPQDLEDNTSKTNISVWDFAGQYAFYNTHQVFLTRRAIYLIVTDMSIDIRDEVNDTCYEDSKGGRKLQVVDFARFWLNSIHEFCQTKKKGEPPVLLVGTFADKYAKKQNIDETKYRMGKNDLEKAYFLPLRTALGDGEAKYHILKHFMIDNTCTVDRTSSQFEELKREILEISKKQSYIGDLIPTKFLLLEEALNEKREEGIKILNKETDFSKCNEELPFKLSEKEVAVFLRFYHEVGSFIYFNENTLKDYILLEPQWLIDAFKELITTEEFMPNDDSETFEIWRQFNETAILKKDLIDKCWKGMAISERTVLLEYMEKFGLIVKDREKQDSYFAPCVLKQAPPENLLKLGDIKEGKCPFSTDGKTFTSKLCYTSKSKFIPMAIFNRLLAECISRWDIRREKNHDYREERVDIYCGCGIFSLRNAHILYLHFRDNVVQIWIVRCSDNSPSKEICLDVKKCMDDFFEKVFKKCEVERHFKCPTGPSWKSAMYPHDELIKGNSVFCDDHKYELTSHDLTGCWFSDDRNDGDTTAVADSGTLSSRSSRRIGQPFKKEYDDTLSQSMVSAMHEQMKSVGVLIFCGKPIGTVFRVGSRCVMTAFHVIKIVLDPSKSGSPDASRLERDETFINFNESPCTPPVVAYRLRKKFIYNVDLDVAVLEILNPNNLPKKLNLRKAATEAKNVSLIGYGHPGDPNKCLDPKCQIVTPYSKRLEAALVHRLELEKIGLSPSLLDKEYQEYYNSSKIVFDCFMEHGASGAPALTYNNQSVEVVGILTHGLPALYYNLPEYLKQHFPSSLRLEGGAKMQDIFEWIKNKESPDLVHDMFY